MILSKYIESLQEKGILYFTTGDVRKKIQISLPNLHARLRYLKKMGTIVSPLKGLYVIVPIQHRAIGCLPPKELIVIIMKHLKIPYYTGLLTAAAYHGATHQRLRVFQVVSNKRFYKDIVIGDVWIEFIYKKDISNVAIEEKVVRTGYLPISTPEETAKDVIMYYKKSGGVNHQATVLSELTQAINTKKMVSLAKRSKKLFWVQRMGYILEHIDTFYKNSRDKLVDALEKFLATQKLRYVALAPEVPTHNRPRNKKWKIIENVAVESDI